MLAKSNGSSLLMELVVERLPRRLQLPVTQNSWSGGNAAGLGIFGGNFAAGNGDNTNLAAIANLGDTATINLDDWTPFLGRNRFKLRCKGFCCHPSGNCGTA